MTATATSQRRRYLAGFLRDRLEGPLTTIGGFSRMCVLTGKALFRWPFQWRELILQCWFIMRVAFLPTIMVSIPLTVLLIFTLNVLLAQVGAADLSGAGAAIGAVTCTPAQLAANDLFQWNAQILTAYPGGVANGATLTAIRDFSVEMEIAGERFILGIGESSPAAGPSDEGPSDEPATKPAKKIKSKAKVKAKRPHTQPAEEEDEPAPEE